MAVAIRSAKRSQLARPRPPRPTSPAKAKEAAARDWRDVAYRGFCAILALALSVALWQLLSSPAWRIVQVEVRGQSLLSREEISRAAGAVGLSVFAVDREAVARAVVALGVVRRVDVSLALPGTLGVQVVEYEPRYVWQTGPSAYLVDERGVVLGAAPAGTALPGLKEQETKLYRRGDRVDPQALNVAAQLRARWPATLGELPALELGRDGLVLNGGKWRADLGEPRDLEAKLLALSAIFTREGTTARPVYLDLRLPERPFMRLTEAR